MPLHVIEDEDITKIRCDALVSVVENTLLEETDGKAVRREEFSSVNKEEIGNAKITKADNAPQKYVVQTVIPTWHGGSFNELKRLRESWKNALELTKKYNCETIAFPLISSEGYPKDQVLSITTETISEFLQENETTVLLVVQNRFSYEINQDLCSDVARYVFEREVFEPCCYCKRSDYDAFCEDVNETVFAKTRKRVSPSLEEKLSKMQDDFTTTLLKLIKAKGVTEVECYKKANVSRQTWYKITKEKDYSPSKNTVISFAIALRLTLEETQKLLATVGYTLSDSSRFDIIIKYFIEKGVYDVFTINETLFFFHEFCLGV